MKSYSNHLSTTHSYGETLPRNYRPTMRSSAVFPVRLDAEGTDALVTFLGYWFLKRSIPEVTVLLTLRDGGGETLSVTSLVIDGVKSFKWSVRELIGRLDGVPATGFRGSVEVEIFSSRDMVFPYPAVTFAYVTEMGLSFVHTCGRIYNDFYDLAANTEATVAETGFDIFPGADYAPFFAFVNGPLAISEGTVELEFLNTDGQAMTVTRAIGDAAPYATMWIDVFSSEAERAFLGGKVGTVKIRHAFEGFFPRFVVGNVFGGDRAVQLTHSYYDTSEDTDPGALWSNPDAAAFHDSVFSFPLSNEFDRTELAIYPIFAPAPMTIAFEFFAADGSPLGRSGREIHIAAGAEKVQYVDVSALAEDSLRDETLALCRVVIDGKGTVPTRLKFGLNFGRKEQVVLPSNVCFGAMVSNAKIPGKPGTFKWCTLFDPDAERIYLTNASFLRKGSPDAKLDITVWRESDGESLSWSQDIGGNGVAELVADRKVQLSEFLSGEVGWLTARADSPFLNGFYVTDYGQGMVGADHVY